MTHTNMDKTKVIFLDFDGVLNTEKYQAELMASGKTGWDEFGQLFDPKAVTNLKMILDAAPNALIVISSSWKMEGLNRLREMWIERGLPGTIHSTTPDFVPDLSQIDLSNHDNLVLLAGKGYEIKAWLAKNASAECCYVIFDDVPGFLPEQNKHLIVTNPSVGISYDDAIAAIKLLCPNAYPVCLV